MILNKPAGLPVHPGRAGGPCVEDFFPGWRRGKTGPWLAHRLDTDTSGCLLVATKKAFLLEAQALFAAGEVKKTYWALVQGVLAGQCMIDAPVAKVTQGRAWKMAVQEDGLRAVTEWRVLGSAQGVSLVEFLPRTGRTHQIRVHAAHLGHPILGDTVYGGPEGKLCLLARALEVPVHPPISAIAPVPEHMRALVEACGGAV